MRKWAGPLVAATMAVLFFYLAASPRPAPDVSSGGTRLKPVPAIFGRTEEPEGKQEDESHYIQVLKLLREEIDGWLKGLNEKIEKEDVTRYKVRFYEILRSVLEWIREKIDSEIAASKKKPQKKQTGRVVRETRVRVSASGVAG